MQTTKEITKAITNETNKYITNKERHTKRNKITNERKKYTETDINT